MDATEAQVDTVDIETGTLPSDFPSLPQDSRFNRALRGLRRRVALAAMRPVAACLGSRHPGAFGILCYHRVSPHFAGLAAPTFNVTPPQFKKQMQGLLARNLQPWSLRAVLDHRRRGEPIPRNVFVVTFDDGYECVYRHAWPVLRELRIPATVFLATAYLDSPGPFPFDDWTAKGSMNVAADSWRPLSTWQCAEMLASGVVEVGCHTHTHSDFRDRPRELYHDLLQSLDALCKRFQLADATTFAFPYGAKRFGFSGPLLAAAAREAGLLCALTSEPDLAQFGGDPFDWGRFGVEEFHSSATIATLLSGWYGLLRNARRQLCQFAPRGHSA